MKEKFARFMMGRYGTDELSKVILGVGVLILLISLFLKSWILDLLVLLVLFYSYYRMFSKNYQKRYAENQAYLRVKGRFLGFFGNGAAHMKQRKTHHIYSCPNCRQKIRVPKGKGKISITCPKCKNEFIKKS